MTFLKPGWRYFQGTVTSYFFAIRSVAVTRTCFGRWRRRLKPVPSLLRKSDSDRSRFAPGSRRQIDFEKTTVYDPDKHGPRFETKRTKLA